jgi:uncharacterized membrane protein YbaN (DUF454 family)
MSPTSIYISFLQQTQLGASKYLAVRTGQLWDRTIPIDSRQCRSRITSLSIPIREMLDTCVYVTLYQRNSQIYLFFFMISNLFWNGMQVYKCHNYMPFFKKKYICVCNKLPVSMTIWFNGWLHVEFLSDRCLCCIFLIVISIIRD